MALTASHQTKRASYRQRRMGPAPFASLEDLSDDQDSPPPGNNGSRLTVLPGIKEDSLQMPATPRIDISRASSSSHQDSNNSSPERELFAGSGEGGMKLGLGFKEEGAADLRSSTEELDFTDDPIGVENRQRRDSQRSLRKRSGSVSKYELEAQSEKERKDSLSIISTGRTSRLSSIGSAASAASSAASHLSVASSGGRSPSPHKMLLETSFCGSKPLVPQASIELDEVPGAKEALHQADPTAVIATADLHTHIRRSSSSASRHRRGPEDAILIMPNVTAVVSPAERELLAAKEKALQEEVQRELENRRAERPPATLNLKGGPDAPPRSISGTPSASPKPTRHHTSMAVGDSRTPSPCSVSRKHSFASLFRRGGGGETTPSSVMSPESPIKRNKSGSFTTILGEGFRERSRSRSKSRERPATAADGPVDAKGRKDSKNKSVFSSLFKKKERKRGSKTNIADSELSSPEPKASGVIEPMGNVEFTFNSELPPPPQPAAPATTNSSSGVCNVIHRSERRSSSGEEKLPSSESASSEHRRSNSSKRMGIHEEQLLPSESVMLPGMPQDLADVLTVSGVGEDDSWWKREESCSLESSKEEHVEARTEVHSASEESKRESVAKSEESVKEEKVETPSETSVAAATPPEPSAEVQPSVGQEEDRISSGSERDSEIDFVRAKADLEAAAAAEEDDHERKGLVLQQDSFEDELPYVPTTLPQERSIAVPIIPVKQRVTQEVKTCPIERPRSTTPINPSLLEEYVQQGSANEATGPDDKMRIQLPKTGSISEDPKSRSPWRVAGAGRSWFEFAEQGSGLQQSPREYRKPSLPASSPSPPPLPPRAPQQQQQQTKQWINFEDIPEKRKPAKRIQTIPTRVGVGVADQQQPPHPVVYSYVNPEDCKCECHEAAGGGKARQQNKQNGEAHEKKVPEPTTAGASSSNKLEVNENTDRNSYLSDSSYEYPNSYGNDPVDYSDGLKPAKPFGMDLDVSSNRSSIISQDETQSPEIGSPNGLKQ